jgi:hypothetical protein
MHPQANHIPPLLVDDEARLGPPRSVWIFAISMGLAKIALISVILLWDFSWLSAVFLALVSWSWIVLGAIGFASPVAVMWRLRRARAKRAALVRSEWMGDEAASE